MSSSCIPPPDVAAVLLAGAAVSGAAQFLSSPALRASPTRQKTRPVYALKPWQQVKKKKKRNQLLTADGALAPVAPPPQPDALFWIPLMLLRGDFLPACCHTSRHRLLVLFFSVSVFLFSLSSRLCPTGHCRRCHHLSPAHWLAPCQTLAKVPAPLVTLSRRVATGHLLARRRLVYPSLRCAGLTGFSSPLDLLVPATSPDVSIFTLGFL